MKDGRAARVVASVGEDVPLCGADVGPVLPAADAGAGEELVSLSDIAGVPNDRNVVGSCPVTSGTELEFLEDGDELPDTACPPDSVRVDAAASDTVRPVPATRVLESGAIPVPAMLVLDIELPEL